MDDQSDIEPLSRVFNDIIQNSYVKDGIEFDIYIHSIRNTST